MLEHQFTEKVINSGTVIVEEGTADSFDMLLGSNASGPSGYIVDINSSSINIDFYISGGGTHFNTGNINGLYFSSEDFNANLFIETATLSSYQFGFAQSRIVLFDEHSIGLNFSEVDFNNNSSLTITFESSTVPIPATVWLFGSGLIGLIGLARKKVNA